MNSKLSRLSDGILIAVVMVTALNEFMLWMEKILPDVHLPWFSRFSIGVVVVTLGVALLPRWIQGRPWVKEYCKTSPQTAMEESSSGRSQSSQR